MARPIHVVLPYASPTSFILPGPATAQSPGGTPAQAATAAMSGRDLTWDMAFLPDGTMFFTEKCRGLLVRRPSGTINARSA